MRELSTTEVAHVSGGTSLDQLSLDANGLNIKATFDPVGQPVKGLLGLLGIQTSPDPAHLNLHLGP